MTDLVVFGFGDFEAAERARARILDLQRQQHIELEDTVVVEKFDGKIRLRQVRDTTAGEATGGVLWEGLIDLLFFMPLLGMAVGAGAGALSGSAADLGVDDDFMRELGRKLDPGNAAVFALVRQASRDKVVEELADMDGRLIQRSHTLAGEQAPFSAGIPQGR
ncbi:DUF1269 domain-containing protein [Glycomyces sp. L485]|uniref:DUF1269 domain-containing protein n=1 Tax=Glycomyces sp. L485 TaxID=2909235 RepID=UPI001F4AEC14|nr:DUF1269 domain-containing protein [Glycomyces sp. L485]MCH7232267.1 DUF1269 domain-containing protein [Glycomyces sp. L485]